MRSDKPALAMTPTPLHFLMEMDGNDVYIKRDDMTGVALGGNKARKLDYFLADAERGGCDHIATYGAAQSNHCRLTAAAAATRKLPCTLILAKTEEGPVYNGNFFLFDLLEAKAIWSEVDRVGAAIEIELERLRHRGANPYFIPGGGHGFWGTHAYRRAHEEILGQAQSLGGRFDYVFFASGTGSTHAGLIVGSKLAANDYEKIIGVSIARKRERGVSVILESVEEYIRERRLPLSVNEADVRFIDDYIGAGYGDIYPDVVNAIRRVALRTGIMLDPVYTGKAFHGMRDYLKKREIRGKRVLFIHTGGAPLLFCHSEKFKSAADSEEAFEQNS